EVGLLDLRADLSTPRAVTRVEVSDFLGSVSVSPTGERAVLYTTATELPRVTILDTSSADSFGAALRTENVRAPVRAAFVAPDDRTAIVALRDQRGNTVTEAFALLPLDEALPAKIQVTEAEVTGVAFSPPPTTSAVLISASAVTSYVAHFPSLQVDGVKLSHLPLAAGVVPEERLAYVLQSHPDGQLALIDLETAELRNLTGFELAGGVRDDR
ncbi:MAG TPA: hypothetical protein VFQ61_27465, partial [Polyangiaceae bacterium]|nr:hypothetical protein [Polyangiaceae bacterium]